MTLFVLVQACVIAIIIVFSIVGAFTSASRRRHDRLRDIAYSEAATVVLDPGPDLERASAALARLPVWLLAEVLQPLTVDMTGEARRRLRAVSQHAGLTRKIERVSRRRSWRRRSQAAHLLMLLPTGSPIRERLLRDPHPFVRSRALESISPNGVGTFVDLLIDGLSNESVAVRTASQHALARGGFACVGAILDGLRRGEQGHIEPEALVLLARVAAENHDPRLIDMLLRFAGDQDPRLRMLVASSLGSGVVHDPTEALTPLLADEEADVRAEAARSVGKGRVLGLAPHLGRMLADDQWQVRREAGAALALLGPIGAVVLRCELTAADPFARDMARYVIDQRDALGSAGQGSIGEIVPKSPNLVGAR